MCLLIAVLLILVVYIFLCNAKEYYVDMPVYIKLKSNAFLIKEIIVLHKFSNKILEEKIIEGPFSSNQQLEFVFKNQNRLGKHTFILKYKDIYDNVINTTRKSIHLTQYLLGNNIKIHEDISNTFTLKQKQLSTQQPPNTT